MAIGFGVSDLVGDAERDLLPVADLTYSLIVRIKNELLDIEVIQFSLIDSLLNPDLMVTRCLTLRIKYFFSAPDLEEVAPDEFARQPLLAPVLQKLRLQAREGEPTLAATISGAVKAPGQYPILKDYGVDDIVKAAGGLLESADLSTAELRRTVTNATGAVDFKYIDVRFDGLGKVTTSTRLQSRDIVTVRDIPDWDREDTISVRGAVCSGYLCYFTRRDYFFSYQARRRFD